MLGTSVHEIVEIGDGGLGCLAACGFPPAISHVTDVLGVDHAIPPVVWAAEPGG
ncbi:hypothetical protein [Rhodococcus sp. IEGM1428]|uniref:hypothetical protein n=1 Tax=Rhodococcus sp. IEGM1428 TaxID=3392191 RepID=UPI003D0DB36E